MSGLSFGGSTLLGFSAQGEQGITPQREIDEETLTEIHFPDGLNLIIPQDIHGLGASSHEGMKDIQGIMK